MQMMFPAEEVRWRKTDESVRLDHCAEHKNLWLIYGRTYTPRAGYTHSQTNQLILNLKILPTADEVRIRYKREAIQRFEKELNELLNGFSYKYPAVSMALVPMPPSKTIGHPDYDDRIDQVALTVSKHLNNVSYLPLLYRTQDALSSHQNPACRRSSEQVYRDLSINEPMAMCYRNGTFLIILDDVLTSGAHFSGARRRLLERFPGAGIGGIFWAKAQAPIRNSPEQNY